METSNQSIDVSPDNSMAPTFNKLPHKNSPTNTESS